MRPGFFTISEMAATYAVTFRALRFYEQQGLLTPEKHGHQRLYSQRDRTRLELILKGKRLGFTLSEVRKLIEAAATFPPMATTDTNIVLSRDQVVQQLDVLLRKHGELQWAIQQLREALAKLDASTLPDAS